MKFRTYTAGIGLLAAVGLIGAGVGASFTDGATATVTQKVGTFSCSVTSTDTNAVVSGNSVVITAPPITSQAAGRYPTNFTVKNTGSMPATVHWDVTTGGSIVWKSAGGRMDYLTGTPAITADLNPLAPGTVQLYTNVGFTWNALSNLDLGKSAQLTYTATCGEVSHGSQISYVGTAYGGSMGGPSSVNLPAWQSGDVAVAMVWPSAVIPTGFTQLQSPTAGSLSYRVLQAGDATATATAGRLQVSVYRGVAGVGASGASFTMSNPMGGAHSLSAPALSLAKTDGTSWVVVLAADGSSVYPAVFNSNFPNMTARYGSSETVLADTNHGVTSWGASTWIDGASGYNYLFAYSLELESK